PLCVLFFYCFTAPLALPSFPTRRSSDLALLGDPLELGRGGDSPAALAREDAQQRGQRQHPADGHGGARAGDRGERADRGEQPVQDRKSTRLNSSHVAISYAVFCLKKKKN